MSRHEPIYRPSPRIWALTVREEGSRLMQSGLCRPDAFL